MKIFHFIIFIAVFVLCFSSCGVASYSTIDTEYEQSEQALMETMPTLEIPEPYYDELWSSTSIMGNLWLEPRKDRQEIVGQEFEVGYAFMTEDKDYLPENYEFTFTISDPTVAEVIAYGYDNYVLHNGSMSAVRLKALKPGAVWLEMKMTHKETGGVYCTYTTFTVIIPPPTE